MRKYLHNPNDTAFCTLYVEDRDSTMRHDNKKYTNIKNVKTESSYQSPNKA